MGYHLLLFPNHILKLSSKFQVRFDAEELEWNESRAILLNKETPNMGNKIDPSESLLTKKMEISNLIKNKTFFIL